MRLFLSSLSSEVSGGGISNPFAGESTLVPYDPTFANHYAFPSMVIIEGRIYVFYRHGTSHVNYGAVMVYQYSDDDGETWSDAVEIYDGTELINDYPTNTGNYDPRDARCLLMSNGRLLFATFVLMEQDDGASSQYANTTASFGIINGNEIDHSDVIYTQIPDRLIGGMPIEKNGVIFFPTYRTSPEYTLLYVSEDFCQTPQVWRSSAVVAPAIANESTIAFIDDKLIMCARNGDGPNNIPVPNYMIESDDFGFTWTNLRQWDYGYRLDGLDGRYLGNGMMTFQGRQPYDDTNARTDNLIVNWETGEIVSYLNIEDEVCPNSADRGYSAIVPYKNKWFIAYMYGPAMACPGAFTNGWPGIYFRQLDYDEATNKLSFGT